jgi:hypothetical protein
LKDTRPFSSGDALEFVLDFSSLFLEGGLRYRGIRVLLEEVVKKIRELLDEEGNHALILFQPVRPCLAG